MMRSVNEMCYSAALMLTWRTTGLHLAAAGCEPRPALTRVTKLLTLNSDVRDVRLACLASRASCLLDSCGRNESRGAAEAWNDDAG